MWVYYGNFFVTVTLYTKEVQVDIDFSKKSYDSNGTTLFLFDSLKGTKFYCFKNVYLYQMNSINIVHLEVFWLTWLNEKICDFGWCCTSKIF